MNSLISIFQNNIINKIKLQTGKMCTTTIFFIHKELPISKKNTNNVNIEGHE